MHIAYFFFYIFAVGCSISQTDTSDLKYLYEGHSEFSAIPSYAVIPAQVSCRNKTCRSLWELEDTLISPIFVHSRQ